MAKNFTLNMRHPSLDEADQHSELLSNSSQDEEEDDDFRDMLGSHNDGKPSSKNPLTPESRHVFSNRTQSAPEDNS